ncbi:MAG: glycoside hydrolase family 3 C-terminal domain-containing protein, partial [Duncaniella sp.]|nr:glycoside hydrolase family 3 C-terminal domain-containing protein [Duncaniella sp.]
VLPQAIGMAATFDDQAVGEAFGMVSDEARAKFNGFRKKGPLKRYQGLAFWTPNINIFRDPRWGRGQETYGEDPYLTSVMGAAVVEGLQGPRDLPYMKTLAGAKHFAVHSGPEWNRHSFDAKNIDPRDLWETYLPAFKVLVDSGVAQVMCAYNRFEGEPCCSNKKLLVQILRDEWGYDRVVVSDCWALRDFVDTNAHHTHATEEEAGADAVMSGTDLECGPLYKSLRKAYDLGLVDEKFIDAALLRTLTERFRLGEIDGAETPWENLTVENTVDTPEHRQIALDMARKSMTLLKNDGTLPLRKDPALKVLVMGPNAVDSAMQWGNYNGFPTHTTTILEGIRAYVPDARYVRGCDHVISNDKTSVFNLFDGGMKATYWNGEAGASTPAAEATYTLPLSFDTGGATVFAPGVGLNDFSARYEGTFIPAEDGDYLIDLKGAMGREVVTVDGREVIRREPGGRQAHTASHIFSAKKGVPVNIALDY